MRCRSRPAAPPVAEREPGPGDVLAGRYEIQSELGRGGMATVYRGLDRRLERRVAVKVFRGGFAEAVDPKRTTQEMRLLAAVNHPSVVAVLDASRGDGVFGAFLVMELVVGDDLGALLHRARGALSPDFARRIVADVASALTALHAQGVVHRDVKPANILVPTAAMSSPTAVAAKLTDFGIAQLVDGARLTGPDSILGTAAYLSPEQVRGAPPRPASDVYSLGLVLLEAVSGRRAFPGPAAESAMARLHRPPALPEEASPALAELLSRMTALDPAHRPAASDVAAILRAQQTAQPAGALSGAPQRPTARPAVLGAPADATLPQEPLLTPSRGMPLSGPVPVGGYVSGRAARTRRRFPTLLAVSAAALAAVVTGVAISAAADLDSAAVQGAAGAGTAPPATVDTQAEPPADGVSGSGIGLVAPDPRPTASRTPTPAATTSAPVPTTSAPVTPPSSTPADDDLEPVWPTTDADPDSDPATTEPDPAAPAPAAPEPAASTPAAPAPMDSAPADAGSPAPADPAITPAAA